MQNLVEQLPRIPLWLTGTMKRAKRDGDDFFNIELPRPAKMKAGLKFPGLAELAAQASGTSGLPPDFASRSLRLVASSNFADPVFLEELVESNLVAVLCAVRTQACGMRLVKLDGLEVCGVAGTAARPPPPVV